MPRLLNLAAVLFLCIALSLWLGVAASAAPGHEGGGGGSGPHVSGGGGGGGPHVSGGGGGGSPLHEEHGSFGTHSGPSMTPRFEGSGSDRHSFDFDRGRHDFDLNRDRDRGHFRDFGGGPYFDFGVGGPWWYDYSPPYTCSDPVQCDNCRRAYDNGDTWYLNRYCSGVYPPY